MSETCADICLESPEATCELARRLAPRLTAGDTILLGGGVGAGKTHFARCLIQTLLCVPEDVPSPSFTLVQIYDATPCEIWHVDLYRLSSALEIEELGLTDAFQTAICLIEWPDRLGLLHPSEALTLTLAPCPTLATETQRRLHLTWQSEKWTQRLEGVLHGGS